MPLEAQSAHRMAEQVVQGLGMYLPYDFERVPTVGADKTVNGDRILFGPVKVPRPAVKLPADSVRGD